MIAGAGISNSRGTGIYRLAYSQAGYQDRRSPDRRTGIRDMPSIILVAAGLASDARALEGWSITAMYQVAPDGRGHGGGFYFVRAILPFLLLSGRAGEVISEGDRPPLAR